MVGAQGVRAAAERLGFNARFCAGAREMARVLVSTPALAGTWEVGTCRGEGSHVASWSTGGVCSAVAAAAASGGCDCPSCGGCREWSVSERARTFAVRLALKREGYAERENANMAALMRINECDAQILL